MANSVTTTMRAQVSQLYVAMFGRAPDGEGLGFWTQQMANGQSMTSVANTMYATSPARSFYPDFLTNAEIIGRFYTNVLGRTADTDGLNYWTAKLNAAGATPGAVISEMIGVVAGYNGTDPAGKDSQALFNNKAAVAQHYAEANLGVTDATTILQAVTKDVATVATANATIDSAAAGSAGAYTLTNGTDIKTASVFTADMVYTPAGNARINSLQDEDQLTGTDGSTDTLNAVLGNNDANLSGAGGNVITPKLAKIETINVAFTGSGATAVNQLDLQDSTGVTSAINITRVSDGLLVGGATIDNIAVVPTDLSVSNSGQPNQTIAFGFKAAAVSGAADSVKLTISDVQVAALSVQERSATAGLGIETINLKSTGAAGTVNTIGVLNIEDVTTLNISGDQNLTLGTSGTVVNGQNLVEATRVNAGLGNVAGSLTSVNASTFTGNLNYVIGAEINAGLDNTSGQSVNLSVLGGSGNDTFTLAAGASVDAADTIDGGTGTNNVFVTYGGTSTITGSANIKGLNALEVRTGHDGGVVADAVTVNADAFAALTSVYVRNEGQQQVGVVWTSAAEGSTVTLNNLTDVQARAITVAHGTTGNSTIDNNIVNVTFKVAGVANATQVTIVDGINIDPVFNLNLGAASSELVTIVDNDTESNSVRLGDAARTQAGSTLTVLPGNVTDAGSYMNFDAVAASLATVADAAVYDYVAGRVGYGRTTDGTLFDNTIWLNRESAQQVTAGGIATRDAAASTVFYGSAGAAGDGLTRTVFENITAGAYAGNVEVRLGDLTRADGVSSMSITTGTGNDTIIFDAIGVVHAGFTSGDTVAAGTGTDTLVIDGNTATIPGTPRIDHQTSEWDNVTGIDVLRFGNNAGVANGGGVVANAAGAYYARIDNDFVTQTDAGNRLLVINNDGDLSTNSESDVVLDLRGLSQSKWVTFQGANGNGAASAGVDSSNRIVVDDISANQNMILNGGDTDVRNLAAANWAGYTAGNNNAYEVRNTANVSISDLALTSNFGLINFTNDQANDQTLTLTLNNTIVEQMVDSSRAATNAATQERLTVIATDGAAAGAGSILNIDARAVTGFLALNVTGSADATAFDVVTLNSNIGGTTHNVNLAGGAGDRANFTGTATTVSIELGAWTDAGGLNGLADAGEGGVAIFQTGAVTTGHIVQNAEIVDITAMTYTSSTILGTAAAETIIGGAGIDAITAGAGADTITTGAGLDNVIFANNTVGVVAAGAATNLTTVDIITDFVGNGAAAGDTIQLGLGAAAWAAATTFTGATVANVTAVTVSLAGLANWTAVTAAIEAASAGVATTAGTAQVYDVTLTAGAAGDFGAGAAYRVAIVNDATATIAAADAVINLTGITGALNAADFLFA